MQEEKFKVLFDLIHDIQDSYIKASEKEKSFYQTIVGAAIFYLPTNKETFSGLISESALLIPKNKWVKEHSYPRKIASKNLLENPPQTISDLKNVFYTKFGIWNYVTKKENSDLRKYQKIHNFQSPEISYQLANIKLVKKSEYTI